jgi:hypothetical protein
MQSFDDSLEEMGGRHSLSALEGFLTLFLSIGCPILAG